MKLYKIRGGSQKELEEKLYRIGVGISLGNKWFSVENISKLVKWSLENSKKDVVVYVADSIHAINLEVRKKISKEKADKIADQLGNKILNEVKLQLGKSLNKEDFDRLRFIKWNSFIDESYLEKLNNLKQKYLNDVAFKNAIEDTVRNFTSREIRKFSDEEINRLGDYIIEELPELLCRVVMCGEQLDAYAYPHDSLFTEFVEKIQLGEIFPEIKEQIIDTLPKVLLVVR